MKTILYRTIFALVMLTVTGTASARPQTAPQQQRDSQSSTRANRKGQDTLSLGMSKETSKEMSKPAVTGIRPEPHEVMAAAYLQNVGIFARALRDQALDSSPLSADFARAVVAEMSRSLDKAQEHQEDHKKTLGPDLRAKLAAVIKEMDTRRAKLDAAVKVLEEDVQNYTLNPKQIAADSDAILKHLDAMSRTGNGK